jgi:hypothetical protein
MNTHLQKVNTQLLIYQRTQRIQTIKSHILHNSQHHTHYPSFCTFYHSIQQQVLGLRMEPMQLPHSKPPNSNCFEDVELGIVDSQKTGTSAVSFPGYHDSEPGAPHDPNHRIPIDELPPRPSNLGHDWKDLITTVPMSALGSVGSAVVGLFRKHATAAQHVHLLALYSIIATLISLLSVAISKINPPQIVVNYPGAFPNCSDISTTTIFRTVTANLTTTSSTSSRSVTTIVIVPTITSHVVVTEVRNHTATNVEVTVITGSGSPLLDSPSDDTRAKRFITVVSTTLSEPTLTSIVLATKELAPSHATVTSAALVPPSIGKRSVNEALESASDDEGSEWANWHSLVALVRSLTTSKPLPDAVMETVTQTEIKHVAFVTTKTLTRYESATIKT